MPKNLLQSQVQQSASSEKQEVPLSYDLQMSWRIRWFFAIFLGATYVFSAVSGFVGFLHTGNLYLLTLVAVPNAVLPAIIYLVPLDEKRYQLKALKIQAKVLTTREKNGN